MAYKGGYYILDLSGKGSINVPGEVDLNPDDIVKVTDHTKPTQVIAKVHLTVSDIESEISGFAEKTNNEGVSALTIHQVSFTRNGNKLTLSAIS